MTTNQELLLMLLDRGTGIKEPARKSGYCNMSQIFVENYRTKNKDEILIIIENTFKENCNKNKLNKEEYIKGCKEAISDMKKVLGIKDKK